VPARPPCCARLAQDDVDGAGHRLAGALGGGDALDLDALDQVRTDRFQREPGRRRHAVQQDRHVAAGQAAHADPGLAARRGVDRDAGLALEDPGQGGVPLAQQLVALDHDGGGGRLAAQVGRGGADLHLLHGCLQRQRRVRGLGMGMGARQQGKQGKDTGSEKSHQTARLSVSGSAGGASSIAG
jgi:hypothetical protein